MAASGQEEDGIVSGEGERVGCGTPKCRSVFEVKSRKHPVDQQMRAAGWRVFDGQTVGGAALRDVRCPACSRPDTRVRKASGQIEGEQRLVS